MVALIILCFFPKILFLFPKRDVLNGRALGFEVLCIPKVLYGGLKVCSCGFKLDNIFLVEMNERRKSSVRDFKATILGCKKAES